MTITNEFRILNWGGEGNCMVLSREVRGHAPKDKFGVLGALRLMGGVTYGSGGVPTGDTACAVKSGGVASEGVFFN